jgi:hypothetical protein
LLGFISLDRNSRGAVQRGNWAGWKLGDRSKPRAFESNELRPRYGRHLRSARLSYRAHVSRSGAVGSIHLCLGHGPRHWLDGMANMSECEALDDNLRLSRSLLVCSAFILESAAERILAAIIAITLAIAVRLDAKPWSDVGSLFVLAGFALLTKFNIGVLALAIALYFEGLLLFLHFSALRGELRPAIGALLCCPAR